MLGRQSESNLETADRHSTNVFSTTGQRRCERRTQKAHDEHERGVCKSEDVGEGHEEREHCDPLAPRESLILVALKVNHIFPLRCMLCLADSFGLSANACQASDKAPRYARTKNCGL